MMNFSTITPQTLLSPHFKLSEFFTSSVGFRRGLVPYKSPASIPGFLAKHPDVLPNLNELASALEIIREHFGQPITLTSGYRTKYLNSLVGGHPNSAHMDGRAADFSIINLGDAAEVDSYMKMLSHSIINLSYYINFNRRYCHVQLNKIN